MDFHTDLDVRESDDIREELQPYVLSQYSASPVIVKLLSDFRDNIDPQADIELFIRSYVDIDTASGIGLDALGRIIGIARTVWYSGNSVTLDDVVYRRLLKFKAMSNITNTSLAALNKILPILFEDNSFSVRNIIFPATDGDMTYNSYPMHIRFFVNRPITETEKILLIVGIGFVVSAGVGWSVAVAQERVFGFEGSGLMPFNIGVFTSNIFIVEEGYE